MIPRAVLLLLCLSCGSAAGQDPAPPPFVELRAGDAWEYEVLRVVKGTRRSVIARLRVTVGRLEKIMVSGYPSEAWSLTRVYARVGVQQVDRSQVWVRHVRGQLSVYEPVGFDGVQAKRVLHVDLQARPAALQRKRFAYAAAELICGPVLYSYLPRSPAHYARVTSKAEKVSVPAGRFDSEVFRYARPDAPALPRWTADRVTLSARAGLVAYHGAQQAGRRKAGILAPTWIRLKKFKRGRVRR